MVNAVIVMGGLGIVVGVGLALASKIFYVYVDPQVAAIDDLLPGANCGGCGVPGCAANASAIVSGESAPDSCVAAGDDVAVAIAAVIGVSVEAKEADIALPGCYYGLDDADVKFTYNGLHDCRAASLLFGGMKECNLGCLGFGTCVLACSFDAIDMNSDGLPVVNDAKCTGCGACERVCPKKIIKLSSVTRRILREYTTEDCTTPCQRACPAGVDIREYIKLVERGNYSGAVQVIKERNPFPSVIGRICPRPCENECRRQYIDEPVAINVIKRFAADYERELGKRILPFKAPNTGKRVAVIGGGVHGLSVSFFVARLGHEVTVFEATDVLGGLLNTAITKYRLPKEVLKWDIDGIKEMGVNFEMCTAVCDELTPYDLLSRGFEAVFIASGGWDSKLSRISCDYGFIEDPIPGVNLLMDYIDGKIKWIDNVFIGINVVCVGGDEVFDEVIKLCKKVQVAKVTFLLRGRLSQNYELFENHGFNLEVEFLETSVLTRLLGKGNKLTSVEIMNLGSGEVNILNTDKIIFSAGRFPEIIFMKSETHSLFNEKLSSDKSESWIGSIARKHPNFSNEIGAFAKSDTKSDFGSAIRAISAGRRAAADIHHLMYQLPTFLQDNVVKSDSFIQNVNEVYGVSKSPRGMTAILESQDLSNGISEIEKGLGFTQVREEASRCLQCGLICYKRLNGNEATSKDMH